MDEQLTQSALDYHRLPTPRKISILPTKGLTNQRDLALAYGGRGGHGRADPARPEEAGPHPDPDPARCAAWSI